MAIPEPVAKSAKLYLVFILGTLVLVSSIDTNPGQTNTVVYLQDWSSGPNVTVVPVTGIPGKLWSFNSFGTIYVVDDPITVYPSPSSQTIGRSQGILVTSALDGSNMHVSLSFLFTNLHYNGSTLQIQGIIRQTESLRELSVVSGTGAFRFMRGYALLDTIYYDVRNSYSIVRCNITLILG